MNLAKAARIAIVGLLIGGVAHAAEVANRIVAIVNEDIITQGDITIRLSGLLQEEGGGRKLSTSLFSRWSRG